jgi:U11/U12 small nuclear ribonucleoprotein SNRNP65
MLFYAKGCDVGILIIVFSVHYSMPPDLEYAYPPADERILRNMMHAIASVPKLYTQVLHLMNKMNLPPPFSRPLPAPPLLKRAREEVAAHEERPDSLASGESSEVSGDEAPFVPHATVPLAPVVAAAAAVTVPPAMPAVSSLAPAPAASAEVPTEPKPKRVMTFRVRSAAPTDSAAAAAAAASAEGAEPGIATAPVPLAPAAGEHRVISLAELVARRLPEPELASMKLFQSYAPGKPTPVLFVKNLPRRVTAEELRYVFGRYFDSAADEAAGLHIRLLEGRMAGQAFVTFPSAELAARALGETHGVLVQDKPMAVVRLLRERCVRNDLMRRGG